MSVTDVTVPCHYCGQAVRPNASSTYRGIHGWERSGFRRPSGARGGSDISYREQLGEWACPTCIDRLKHGVSPAQTELV